MNEIEEEYLIAKIISEIKSEDPLTEIISFLKEKNVHNFFIAKIAFKALK